MASNSIQEAASGVRDAHGRVVNAISDVYLLPADETEHERLDIQHQMHKRRLKGLFPNPDAVYEALTQKPGGPRPAILDIGSGSGSWPVEMATLFPHADVVGMDLVAPTLTSPPLPNCRFEIRDMNSGLSDYHGAYDVVHMRSAAQGCKYFRNFLQQLSDILRPGGVLIIVEGDLTLRDAQKRPITAQEGEPGFSYMAKMLASASETQLARPYCVDSIGCNLEWIREMPDWQASGRVEWYNAAGPWEPNIDEEEKDIAELQRQNFLKLPGSLRILLLESGYPAEVVDRWVAGALDELTGLKVHIYCRWTAVWALKKDDDLSLIEV